MIKIQYQRSKIQRLEILKSHDHPIFVKIPKFVSSSLLTIADQTLKISAFINNRKWDKKKLFYHALPWQQLCVIMHKSDEVWPNKMAATQLA